MNKSSQEKIIKRLNRLKGQIEGVTKMVEADKNCVKVLMQILAVQGALKGVASEVMEGHLSTCSEKHLDGKKCDKEEFMKDLMKAFSLFNR